MLTMWDSDRWVWDQKQGISEHLCSKMYLRLHHETMLLPILLPVPLSSPSSARALQEVVETSFVDFWYTNPSRKLQYLVLTPCQRQSSNDHRFTKSLDKVPP